MLLRGIVLGLALLQVSATRAEDETKTRRESRETKGMESLLQSLIKARAKPDYSFVDASQSPIRCAEIEYYLRSTVKMRGIVSELALIVESHDSKLTPTRVYRVKYEDKRGKEHTDDFILQQHGAEWRVKAHVPPVALPEPAPQPIPEQATGPAVSVQP